jgi:hypothetical protein
MVHCNVRKTKICIILDIEMPGRVFWWPPLDMHPVHIHIASLGEGAGGSPSRSRGVKIRSWQHVANNNLWPQILEGRDSFCRI